jgi:FKBP-type peptidyl-prolyl cis-trans isomerase
MKFRQICFLTAGLASFGAMAQDKAPATNTPAGVPMVNGNNFTAVLTGKGPATNTPAGVPPTNAPPAEVKPAVEPDKGQLSYAVGVYYANNLKNDLMSKLGLEPKLDLDMDRLFAGYSNVIAGSPTTMNTQEAIKVLQQQSAYQKERVQEEIKKITATGPENKTKGEKFMEDIAGAPGVKKLTNGVVYKVIKEGDGVKPASTDMATVSFHATLIDGTEVWKVEHASIPVTHQLIPPGVTEALTLMKAGSHWTVYLPYPEAYGEKPGISDPKHGYKVGPYSALIFDLELESVQPRPAPPAGAPPGMRSGGPMMMPPGTAVTPPGATVSPHVINIDSTPSISTPVTSSSIVRVPSADEMAKGEKPRVMTDAEIEAAKKAAQTNATTTNAPSPK